MKYEEIYTKNIIIIILDNVSLMNESDWKFFNLIS